MKKVWATCTATMLFVGLVVSSTGAQQSGTPAKPAEGAGSPPASTGTAATPGGAELSQKVVLKVGETTVTESEIDALLSKVGTKAKAIVAAQGRRPVGEQYERMLLLSRRALDEHLDSSPALHSRLELQRTETLAEAEYEKMSGEVKVSQEEVGQYFAAHPSEFDTVQVREFVIRERPKGSENAKLGLTAEDATAKAESIRKALLAGTDVEKVAEDFVDPPNVLMVDRKPRTARRGEMMPDLGKAVFKQEDGGVSELVDTSQSIFVVKVLKHDHPELKDVATEIENKLRQQKLDAEMDQLKEKAGVWMDEEYFKGKPVATPGSAGQPPASPGPVSIPKPAERTK